MSVQLKYAAVFYLSEGLLSENVTYLVPVKPSLLSFIMRGGSSIGGLCYAYSIRAANSRFDCMCYPLDCSSDCKPSTCINTSAQ